MTWRIHVCCMTLFMCVIHLVLLRTSEPNIQSKEPNIHSKEPNIHSKEPYIHSKEPCIHSNEPNIHTKEPYIHSKEPNIHSKEPNIHSKEPNIHSKEPNIHSNEPNIHTKEPYVYSKYSAKETCNLIEPTRDMSRSEASLPTVNFKVIKEPIKGTLHMINRGYWDKRPNQERRVCVCVRPNKDVGQKTQ